jgi:cytochrome c-type biogenesis protein CcmH
MIREGRGATCRWMWLAVSVLLFLAVPALAQVPVDPSRPAAEIFQDPATLQRIKRLESELRCLVCQAQSVAESDSDFSADIRREINRMILEGRSDDEIKAFLVERYGDFILYRPPLQTTTMLLWGGPAILLVIGMLTLVVVLRRRRSEETIERPISEEERRRAAALLASQVDSKGSSGE